MESVTAPNVSECLGDTILRLHYTANYEAKCMPLTCIFARQFWSSFR